MISTLELRRIVETSFLPLHCQCTVGHDGAMTVRICDPSSGRVDLFVTGIATRDLTSARAIGELIAELRYDLRHTGLTEEQGGRRSRER
ncbi:MULTISPECIES: DUF1652 domain-containing protein [Pseudomonas]|uniref:DUF1652 domain-containing protein n=1 Tax=Pseudomonas sessilinigenes TaxID=658629 RepID=A0ABX8MKN6_9PSED|nr:MULTISPECIES: DUF1652 domain-containing protein [Pseudomonas]AZC27298.1 hypothetical protein C4K39_5657 [Pseudomonas sessilinigenes]QIH09467.1 DUF1652 domain-containing protein [Pseudomonas sp. BIOMIG1BAC]QXH38784.1 DUF1652 domain-containing protein [Pseudomonas sessilinigenes]